MPDDPACEGEVAVAANQYGLVLPVCDVLQLACFRAVLVFSSGTVNQPCFVATVTLNTNGNFAKGLLFDLLLSAPSALVLMSPKLPHGYASFAAAVKRISLSSLPSEAWLPLFPQRWLTVAALFQRQNVHSALGVGLWTAKALQ